MAILLSNQLDGSQGFYGFNTIEAIGIANYGSIAAPPQGIPGRVDFGQAPDGTMAYHSQAYLGDPLNVGGTRAEITLADDELIGAGLFNAPFWYYWEMYIPSSWPKTGNPYTVMQIHDAPDTGDPAVWPNFELMIRNDQIYAMTPLDFASKTDAGVTRYISATVQFDRWVRCALSAKWDKSGSTGWMEFYYDDVKVDGKWHFRSNRNTVKGPYWRLGVYDCLHYLDFGKLEAWYRNAKWADGVDGYTALSGVSPKSPSRRAFRKI